ncbi:hypothetical protein R3F73_30510 [Bradyrhizobium japonicum]|uniref:hypothetical protein n=1 Tax=Bradyrhizobium japonicum TaxID=375 RepID=UPI002B486D9A|nr:hypothetical protein [Bradyrhizobium japonicum]WRK43651.1 hypothetical protein R3F73_30510 [Bradyrhizobium japonicum]
MATILVILSLLGANNLEQLGITLPKHLGYLGVPLALAFVLMGGFAKRPGSHAGRDAHMRQYAHERAYIPDAARVMAERIATADFDFTSYRRRGSSIAGDARRHARRLHAPPPHARAQLGAALLPSSSP